MSLFRRAFPEFRNINRQLEDFFSPVFTNRLRSNRFGHDTEFLTPVCDIHDAKDKYIIETEMPGVQKEDIKFDLSDDHTITLRAELKESTHGTKRQGERFFGLMERSVTLPTKVIPEKIQAELKDGILKIEVLKMENDEKPISVTWK